MDKPLKVLILTYYWPPSGGSGVQRWMYFAKYLAEFGITPIVLTVSPEKAAYPSLDESLSEQVKHVEVHHTAAGFEILQLYSFLKSGNSRKEIPTGNFGGRKKSMFDKAAGFIRGNFMIPDARIGWNKYAYKKSMELVAAHDIDLIITTGPPHSTHLVGLKLKRQLGVRWMADFRDPWTEAYYNNLFKRTRAAANKDAYLELNVLTHADCILTVGPAMQRLLAAKIPGHAQKVHFIYNGFDADSFTHLQKTSNETFTISYVGTMGDNYPYRSFAAALKNFITAHPSVPVKLILAGRIEEQICAEFTAIENLQTEIKGIIPQTEAHQLMVQSDLLLLILPTQANSQIMVTGKLMEYMATGNPVLCIGDTLSDAAKLLQKRKDAYTFEGDQITEISAALEILIFEKKEIAEVADNSFSRYETTRALSVLVKQLHA